MDIDLLRVYLRLSFAAIILAPPIGGSPIGGSGWGITGWGGSYRAVKNLIGRIFRNVGSVHSTRTCSVPSSTSPCETGNRYFPIAYKNRSERTRSLDPSIDMLALNNESSSKSFAASSSNRGFAATTNVFPWRVR